jgi:hypothetical protein
MVGDIGHSALLDTSMIRTVLPGFDAYHAATDVSLAGSPRAAVVVST